MVYVNLLVPQSNPRISTHFVVKAKKRAFNSPNMSLVTVPFIVGVTILLLLSSNSASAICELSYRANNKLYNYSLASPLDKYPHGVLSEDGYFFQFLLLIFQNIAT